MRFDEEFLRGMHVSVPKKRDSKIRPTAIPKSVLENKKLERPTLR